MDEFEARLARIKAEGLTRRARRGKRNTAIAGVAFCLLAIGALAGPLELGQDGPQGGRDDLLAGRGRTDRCRNSTDPSCGEFMWDPEPSTNRPASVEIAPVAPVTVGVPAELIVTWRDPDARRATPFACWDDAPCSPPPPACEEASAAGPWTPPDAEPGDGTFRLEHTFMAPGSYDVTVTVRTAAWPNQRCAPVAGDPYADDVTTTITVIVR